MFVKYILLNHTFIFFKNTIQHEKNTILFFNKNLLYYFSLHLKLSSLFYSTQLVDMFAYDAPMAQNLRCQFEAVTPFAANSAIIGYNFQNLLLHDRFFVFTDLLKKKTYTNKYVNSITTISELFPTANWLEREISELHAIEFFGKKDTRNLMLPYGDSSAPFKKTFPCVGLKEIYYDTISDQLVFNEISLQF